MKIIRSFKSSLFAASFAFAPVASAEVAIIVNADSEIANASTSEVAQLFLGKRNRIDGQAVRAVDQSEGQATRDEFYNKVVGKTASQLNAYWSRLIFTGKGTPPDQVDDDAEVVEYVAEDVDLVGYVSPSAVDETVKVILVIP